MKKFKTSAEPFFKGGGEVSLKFLQLKVKKKNGLHVRMAAALISKLQTILKDSEQLKKVYVIYNGKKVQATNLISLVSLKISQNDNFTLSFEEDVDQTKLLEVVRFFDDIEQEDAQQTETDRLLMENSLILQEAITGLPNGIVVVDRENMITYVNEVASKLLEKSTAELVNQPADQMIPRSKLKEVLKTGKADVVEKQQLNSFTILTNRSPVFYNGEIIGAVAVFQDISNIEKVTKELKEVRELQERLHLVLQSVSDLIGLTDQKGRFIYMNKEMKELLYLFFEDKEIQSIIGENKWSNIRKHSRPLMEMIKLKNQTSYITKIYPIFIDEDFRGTVVTLTPFHEVQSLLNRLDLAEQRTEYLEMELLRHQELDKAFKPIIGNSEALMDSLFMANKVSKTDSTVIITGESGTGKELVARAIHDSSNRKSQPFIRVNSAAIPTDLIESELFGHEKGAFTGAFKRRIGKFELADKGTIFLDEIGDLNLDVQAKLLRVLQEQEIDRIGGIGSIPVDVRVIAATNRNLKKMVDEGLFREDLYYRLHVIPIHLPPLRDRKEDIPLLVDYFRETLNKKLRKNIMGYEKGFIETLSNYQWPGNIRELQNVIERVMNLTDRNLLINNELPNYISTPSTEKEQTKLDLNLIDDTKILTIEEYEKIIFTHACQYYSSYNQLANALGITHKTAAKKVRMYQLEGLLGKKSQVN